MWLQLFFRPGRFFADADWRRQGPTIVLIAWACGIAACIARLHTRMLRADLGSGGGAWEVLAPWLQDSWLHFWVLVLALGAPGAVALWYFGGWLYRLRLGFSGAADADKREARVAFAYQEFVAAAALLLTCALQTCLFADVDQAWHAAPTWVALPLLAVLWSCWASYHAAVNGFGARRGPALLWFALLPALGNGLALGLPVWALFAQGGAA